MNTDIFFHTRPVFRYDEFVAWKQQHGDVKPHSVDTALQYHIKKGRLLRLHRELYAVVLPGQSSDSILLDSYLIAARAAPDSVLSYHTALELHGVAHSAFERLTYCTHQGNKPFEFQNRLFRSVTFPSALVRTQNALYGVESVNRQGITIHRKT